MREEKVSGGRIQKEAQAASHLFPFLPAVSALLLKNLMIKFQMQQEKVIGYDRFRRRKSMRRYQKKTKELEQVVCNCCGRTLKVEHGILKEGACRLETVFGYFSGKDMEKHSFDLCEACYDRMIAGFAVPVEIEEETELFPQTEGEEE